MRFLLRQAKREDLQQILTLAGSFSLLNLPSDEDIISDKLERSMRSFSGELTLTEECEYLFVVEDLDARKVVGTSLILAKHGTEDFPHTYFSVSTREKYSKELGLGFIHQVLKMCYDTDGPTEIGGLLVDDTYRRRPEKLGKQISLIRFLYMAMFKNRFEDRVLCELTPPLTADGRSEFWEAFGRKFTGLPYQEADYLSRQNKEFIKQLFPDDEIYTCLLDARARYVIGRVGLSTQPARHLLESIGFRYLNEIDPFDGGPHYGSKLADITVVKKAKSYDLAPDNTGNFDKLGLIGANNSQIGFRGCLAYYDIKEKKAVLPQQVRKVLKLDPSEKIFISPISEGTL